MMAGRSYLFTHELSQESEGFERELQQRLNADIAWGQGHACLRETPREFRLFQLRDPEGRASMQAVVYVSRSRLWRRFAQANIPRMAPATSLSEQEHGLKLLRNLCLESDHMTLRLQPFRTEARDLDDFEKQARAAGFAPTAPFEATHTALVDVSKPPEALLAGLRRSTRQRIRHKSRELVTLAPLTDRAFIARCREAENAARGRTRGASSAFDFETFFGLTQRYPDRAFLMGLFLKSKPGVLMAFVTGIRHGRIAEYTSAGSFLDEELRSIPFNSFLIWELMLWAHASGASELDLGGITSGGPGDPLAGISEFKRSFSGRELEVGREMLSVLKPSRYALFRAVRGVTEKLRR